MISSKRIIQFSASVLFAIFAGASINAVIWETIGLTISFANRHSGHNRVWDGPTLDRFVHLKLVLFAVFAFVALFKVGKIEDLYRRFRWIFAIVWVFWILIVLALDLLTGGNPKLLAFTRLMPDPAIMGMLAGIMTMLLFFRTYRRGLNSSEVGKNEIA